SDEGAEIELPDFDAIEKGAPAPASMSFRHAPTPQLRESKSLSAGRDNSQEEAGARQIEGAAVGLIPPGGLYGVDSNVMSTVSSGGEEGPPGVVPEYHVV